MSITVKTLADAFRLLATCAESTTPDRFTELWNRPISMEDSANTVRRLAAMRDKKTFTKTPAKRKTFRHRGIWGGQN